MAALLCWWHFVTLTNGERGERLFIEGCMNLFKIIVYVSLSVVSVRGCTKYGGYGFANNPWLQIQCIACGFDLFL